MKEPKKLCQPCGRLLGGFYIDGRFVGPATHIATYTLRVCDVCGDKTAVGDLNEYGGLKKDWTYYLKR
jgi:hypothetical protein